MGWRFLRPCTAPRQRGGWSQGGLPLGGQGAIGVPSINLGPGGTLRAVRSIGLCLTALPLFLALPSQAWAQDAVPVAPASTEPTIDFSADQVIYDSNAEVVTASGQVRMSRDGNYLAANQVSWDRNSGRVVAEGDVVVVNT